MAIYRGEGGAGDSNTDATISQVTAQANIATTKAAEAAASAAEALDSKNTITQMTAATGAAGTEVLFNSITGVLTVPRGDKGDTGDTGAPGIDGNDGIDGTNGLGWTGGSYNGSTGIVTFTSTDGLGFSTTDLRGTDGTNGTDGIDGIDGTNGFNGADGADGLGWTGGSYNGTTGIVTFTSTDGLGFSTTDLRGTNGTDGTDGIDGIDGTNGINGADGADGLGWTGGSYNSTTGIVTFTSTDGLGFVTGDLRAPGGLFLTDFSVTVATAGTANLAYNNTNGVFTYTPPDLSGYYPTSNPNGYTDDQTASEIKTAYESNANTNAYTDAEKSKLAGVEANANNYTLPFADNSANWNTAYSYSQVGHLPLSGGTLTGNIDFNDGVRARFGASDDLQIWHTGTLSYIQDTGTGSLNIETNGTHINLRGGAGNNDMAKFQSNGGVQLFHSGSEKLEVTSTGIDVTGTVVATGGNSTNWNTAYGWGDHASAGYYPASNPNGYTSNVGDITDVVAGLGITGGSTSGSATISMDWVEYDTFTGTYPIVWKAVNKPYSASWFTINGTTDTVTAPNFTATTSLRANVIYDSNNTGNYLDSPTSSVFRLNGSTAVNLAVGGATKLVATSTGVGIGTSSPSEKLHVQDSTGSPQIRIDNQGTASGIASLLFRSGGAGNPSSIIQSGGTSSGNQGIVFKHGDFGAEVERMRIDSAGAVTAYNSLRAPIFYDSNNTGYYTDPASISRMAYVYANKVYFPANASYKIGFWGGTTNYTIGMSQAWDATNGGRVAGETTSDYNMYFTMSGGTNRGFVFRNSNSSGSAVAGIDAGGNARFNGSVGVNGSTVIDPSRNLININDFTSTGTVYLDNPNNSSTTDPNIDSKGALTSGTAYSYHALFKDGNGNIKGRITHNQYGAQFSNLSDYRAKEDYQEVENATSRLMSIPVRNFQWIGSDLRTDGFLAHEIAEVIPEAVVGEKDAVLEDGTPDYQSIDQSKIVPLLVKTIQEQQAVIESLEARLIALENA